jgi:hypothetical protein
MCKRTIFADSTESFHIFLPELGIEFFQGDLESPVLQNDEKGVKPFFLFFSDSANQSSNCERHVTPTADSRDNFENSRPL